MSMNHNRLVMSQLDTTGVYACLVKALGQLRILAWGQNNMFSRTVVGMGVRRNVFQGKNV